VHNVRNKKL